MGDFALHSRDEVARFEELLDAYVKARTGIPVSHISLTGAYEYLRVSANGGRIFAALLDFHLGFLLLFLDIFAVGSIWNAHFSKGKIEGGSVLDGTRAFNGKIDIHRFSTSYVLRYRPGTMGQAYGAVRSAAYS